ncbi:glycosyltransferase family 2 protein [Roseivirga sp. E12]|uniref:glycosyltransferase family 2 protein n=1 Tax=Roseivirga sp. E12 TaxID=2819237 RepID=UPI001ABC4480|nr:glycosyltransferase family 2 protein [Roseivirga sp. E12]MBO3697789.1 glycosyltransferase family 2 protein [Roseivirga sp. E12]
MPVKNLDRYLTDCLSSIVDQSFIDWELIIVNDHSTDQTLSILEEFSKKDERIRYLTNTGKGITPALQIAIEECSGEFLTRFDGDDLMPEGRLELMIKAIASSPPKTIVTGKVKYFGDQPISEGYLKYEGWLNKRVDQQDHWNWVYRECVIASPNWMMRRKELEDIQPLGAMTYPEDYNLVLEWYQSGFNVRAVDAITLHWREHAKRTSRNSDYYNQEHFFKLKIEHLVKHQSGSSDLVLWGTDTKGRISAQILDQLQVPFHWMGLNKKSNSKGILGHQVVHYQSIEKLNKPKLLIAVFPPQNQRLSLEKYLHSLNLIMGKDYWYL